MGLVIKNKEQNVIDVAVKADSKEGDTKLYPGGGLIPSKQQMVSKTGKGVVSKAHPDGSKEEQQTPLGTLVSDKPMATVFVSLGMTKNLGNYESLKMTVGVTLPSEPNDQALEATYGVAKAWCDEHLNQIVAEVNSELGQG